MRTPELRYREFTGAIYKRSRRSTRFSDIRMPTMDSMFRCFERVNDTSVIRLKTNEVAATEAIRHAKVQKERDLSSELRQKWIASAKREEAVGKRVIAGRDCAVDLEMPEHALDAISLAIETPVPTDRGYAMRARDAAP
jgi:hypothetical protein